MTAAMGLSKKENNVEKKSQKEVSEVSTNPFPPAPMMQMFLMTMWIKVPLFKPSSVIAIIHSKGNCKQIAGTDNKYNSTV